MPEVDLPVWFVWLMGGLGTLFATGYAAWQARKPAAARRSPDGGTDVVLQGGIVDNRAVDRLTAAVEVMNINHIENTRRFNEAMDRSDDGIKAVRAVSVALEDTARRIDHLSDEVGYLTGAVRSAEKNHHRN